LNGPREEPGCGAAEPAGMSDSLIARTTTGTVATLRLNRPDKLNAFNEEMTEGLIAALEDAGRDPNVRAIVLAGTGRGFSAGQDLEAFVRMQTSPEPVSVGDHLRRGYNVLVTQIRTIEKPVIAALNGIAAGVGLSIALACDLRIAADDAVLTLGFSKIGLVPDGGGSLMLPLLAGFGRGLELAWSSDKLDAQEALRIGLVNRVVPAAIFEDETLAYAQKFAALSPVAIGLTKRAFNRSMIPHLAQWLEEEADLQTEASQGPDLREGVTAFMQKRKPAFAAR
jgi:2-(1,2-epoxy-1,2-dihydrophenyl)acetyl-CoA isomerase